MQCVPNAETKRTIPTDQSSERKASTIPKQKSMDWHGAGNTETDKIGWKALTMIGYKPSIFSIGETVKVDFRLSPNTPVVQTITAKVIDIIGVCKCVVVINSPFENKYEMAYGRIYN